MVNFSLKYGVKTATDAFGVSRATVFRWRKRLKDLREEA